MPGLGRGTVLRITGFVTLGFFAAYGLARHVLPGSALLRGSWSRRPIR